MTGYNPFFSKKSCFFLENNIYLLYTLLKDENPGIFPGFINKDNPLMTRGVFMKTILYGCSCAAVIFLCGCEHIHHYHAAPPPPPPPRRTVIVTRPAPPPPRRTVIVTKPAPRPRPAAVVRKTARPAPRPAGTVGKPAPRGKGRVPAHNTRR